MVHAPASGRPAPARLRAPRPASSTSPVTRLPVEILALVFHQLWAAHTALRPRLDIETWPWQTSLCLAIIAVSHVSRQWRQIALALPVLWSRADDQNGHHIRLFLNRSRTAPLDLAVCLSITHPGISHSDLDALLVAASPRLRRFDVRLEAVHLPRLDFAGPTLEALTIQCEKSSSVELAPHPVLFRGQTTSLRALALLHVRHWLPGNHFPNLVHLNISYFFQEELSLASLTLLLRNCPRLETLHYGQIWSYLVRELVLDPPVTPVALPHLRSLTTCCATMQTAAALLSCITFDPIPMHPVRVRIHDAVVQAHTDVGDNHLPSLRFLGPIARLELAADPSRAYVLVESHGQTPNSAAAGENSPSALWIQAEFQAKRTTAWLLALFDVLDLSALDVLHVSSADWSFLPALLRRAPELNTLGVMALPDAEPTHAAMFITLTDTLLASHDAYLPSLSTLSVQAPPSPTHAASLARLAARRADMGFRLTRLVFDGVPVPVSTHPAPPSPLDARRWAAVRTTLQGTLQHVGVLAVGQGGACAWAHPHGWDAENPYWRLPEGDEPRCSFPWR
ncbi:uncharacterized protein BXZ73DRAFT_101787 [Epithele typhae]|uniref:uncharacterized protein n=1 Tax=Epithele typhae TaxID=378194 RepID=UPI0020086AAE|nr:uncharacterized protein BXZ73DRAFT_101787 [Epithele typhae]KAH9930413.1 hypothetical protein BXZ73DRAFT_101787 [Epithele typhae]